MPFDTSQEATMQGACLPGRPDLSMAIAFLPEEKRPQAVLALCLGHLTEDLVALLANVKVSTLRDWRVDRIGPYSTSLGNSTLYPIEQLRQFLQDGTMGTRAIGRTHSRKPLTPRSP